MAIKNFMQALARRKKIDDQPASTLNRCLNTFDLTFLGKQIYLYSVCHLFKC